MFDLPGFGRASQIAWTEPAANNAFLVLDRNNNGRVDNGSELFGGSTPQPDPMAPERKNGYLALAVFDFNSDGQITIADAIYPDLKLWRDANHNGFAESEELSTLEQNHVTAIGVTYAESRRRDRFNNGFRYRAKVTVVDTVGTHERWSYDVFLRGR